jgi:hypothetical protein
LQSGGQGRAVQCWSRLPPASVTCSSLLAQFAGVRRQRAACCVVRCIAIHSRQSCVNLHRCRRALSSQHPTELRR